MIYSNIDKDLLKEAKTKLESIISNLTHNDSEEELIRMYMLDIEQKIFDGKFFTQENEEVTVAIQVIVEKAFIDYIDDPRDTILVENLISFLNKYKKLLKNDNLIKLLEDIRGKSKSSTGPGI
jgi:nitrogenase subunit NifH